MSLPRTCPNCFQKEASRHNFGSDLQAEREFHQQRWCDCGYASPEAMMADQDMPFADPQWIPFAKHFLEEYHLRFRQGGMKNKTELVRFFLRLLQSSANNLSRSINLSEQKSEEKYRFVYDGESDHKPQTDIFRDSTMFECSAALLSARIRAANFKENMLSDKHKRNRRWGWAILGLIVGLIIGSLL